MPDSECEAHKQYEFLNAHEPDVILLMMGYKDLQLPGDRFASAADRYDILITKLASSRPEAHIFVSNFPPRKNSDQNQMIDELFNPRIPAIVAVHEAACRHVTFVDLRSIVSLFNLANMFQPPEEG